jgi:hypothetical protein
LDRHPAIDHRGGNDGLAVFGWFRTQAKQRGIAGRLREHLLRQKSGCEYREHFASTSATAPTIFIKRLLEIGKSLAKMPQRVVKPDAAREAFSFPRPLIQHPHPLPYRHADPRPVLGPTVKDTLGLVEATAGKQQFDHALSIAGPLLDLVEVAMVRD